MARLNIVGFDNASASECRSITGATTFSNSIRRAGVGYSYTCTPVTTGTANVRIGALQTTGLPTAEFNVATLYWRVYFDVTSLPSSLNEEVVTLVDSSGTFKSSVRITSTGTLLVIDNAQATAYTSSTAVSTGGFYRLEGMTTTSGSASAYEVRLYTDPIGNSVAATEPVLLESMSGTMTQGSANHGSFRVGKSTNRNGIGYLINFDDAAVDDATWCGDSQIRLHLPTANGSASSWSSGTNSSNYLETDEIPEDDATTYLAKSAASDQTHYVTFQSCSTVGVSGEIKAVKLGVRTQENSAATTSTRPIMKSSATTAEQTGFNGSTTWVSQWLLRATDPNTSSAWTVSGIDALEGGVRDSAATANARCSAVYLVTEFQANQYVNASLISSTATFFDATVTQDSGEQTITTNAPISGSEVFEPTVTATATIATAAPSSGSVFYQPTVSASAAIVAELVPSASTVYQPSVTASAEIVASLIPSGANVFEPAVSSGAVAIVGAAPSSSAVVHEPAVTSTASIEAELVGPSSEVFEPEVAPGEVSISPVLLASTAQVFEPTLTGGITTPGISFGWTPYRHPVEWVPVGSPLHWTAGNRLHWTPRGNG